MSFAILRFEKLKQVGAIAASGGHMVRARPTANADPGVGNRVLVGSLDPAKDVDRRLAAATQRRSNSVLAIEVLMTASPEFFANASKEQKQDWLRSSKKWLSEHFGEDNVVHLQLHLDETTPHLTGFVVPLDPDSGRLNAARWLDGSAKLADAQTEYAQSVAHLGLERGLEGSTAQHTTIRQFYAAMSQSVDAPETPIVAVPPPMARQAARAGWAEGETERLRAEAAPSIERLQAQARAGIAATRRVAAYQELGVQYRDAAQAARDIPVNEVVERLGLARDRADRAKWVDTEGRIALALSGQSWFDHKAQAGGGGAIDLVMHVMGSDYLQAVAWLGHQVGEKRTAAAMTARTATRAPEVIQRSSERGPFVEPARGTDEQQAKVRAYLMGRGLGAALIDHEMANGMVSADSRGNAAFVSLMTDGKAGGAELRGTGDAHFHGLAVGSTRDATYRVEAEGRGPKRLILVESAIDALSYLQLHPGEALVVASTSGARPSLPASLAGILADVAEVVVAYDADAKGREMAEKMRASVAAAGSKVTVEAPTEGKDWNDALRSAQEAQWEAKKAAADARLAAIRARRGRGSEGAPEAGSPLFSKQIS